MTTPPDPLEIVARRPRRRPAHPQVEVEVVAPFRLFAEPVVRALDVAAAGDQFSAVDHQQLVVHAAEDPPQAIEAEAVELADRHAFGRQMGEHRARHPVPLRVDEQTRSKTSINELLRAD